MRGAKEEVVAPGTEQMVGMRGLAEKSKGAAGLVGETCAAKKLEEPGLGSPSWA